MSKFSADSSKAEQLSFQIEEGGAVPTSALQLRVRECSFRDISWIFRKYHYKSDHMGGGIDFCLALTLNDVIVGGMVIGKPRHERAYNHNGTRNVVEIRRMALTDAMPKNSESYFLSKAIWVLRKNTTVDEVISYSDLSVGHIGTVYRAANFSLIGKTAPSKHIFWQGKRYHPRSLTINRPYSYRLRDAVKRGEAVVATGKPKLIFSYKIKR